MDNIEPRIPTKIWLLAQLRAHENTGVFYTILQHGEENSGIVCVKWRVGADITLYTQERNAAGQIGWRRLRPKETPGIRVEEAWADGYIARAIARDPDLWVVEIESNNSNFPLEGPVFDEFG